MPWSDPAFLLCPCAASSFLSGEGALFKIPVLGSLVRALESLPVYRRQDEGEDVLLPRDIRRRFVSSGKWRDDWYLS